MGFNISDVGMRGRGNAAVKLTLEDNVVITSDEFKHDKNQPNTTIELSEIEAAITILSDTIKLQSNNTANADEQSIVLGESLVEVLRWMIQILMSHTHPPNAPPVNSFFNKAREYHTDMDKIILNKNIKIR